MKSKIRDIEKECEKLADIIEDFFDTYPSENEIWMRVFDCSFKISTDIHPCALKGIHGPPVKAFVIERDNFCVKLQTGEDK